MEMSTSSKDDDEDAVENGSTGSVLFDDSTSGTRSRVGWLVVAAAFFAHILYSLHIHLTAVMLTEFGEHFRVSVTVLGTLSALRAGVLQFAGRVLPH